MPSLDSINFDGSDLEPQSELPGERLWFSKDGDPVWLYYFAISPNLPADLESINMLRACYRRDLTPEGNALVEVDALLLDGCRALRVILKTAQEPHGMSYLGSLTIPFKDFSYVLKMQCEEYGTTGLRDCEIFGEMMLSGQVSLDELAEPPRIIGWACDPYDPQFSAKLLRNRSEDDEYDARFPGHPLSRLRRFLKHVQETIAISQEVKAAPSFSWSKTV